MPRGDKKQIMEYPITIPSKKQLIYFNELANPILKKVQELNEEKRNLMILRNTLLPKLMSGEIDVSSIKL